MGHNINNLFMFAPIYKVMSYDSDIKLSHLDSHNRVPIISPAFKQLAVTLTKFSSINHLYKYQYHLQLTKSAHPCVRNEKSLQSHHLRTSLWQSLVHLADNNGLNLQFKSTCFLFPDSRCFSNRSSWKWGSISPPLVCWRKRTRPKLPVAAISGNWGDRRVSQESEGHHLKPRGKTLKCHTHPPPLSLPTWGWHCLGSFSPVHYCATFYVMC